MSHDVVIPPDLWEEDQEGVITNWMVSDGAQVTQGQLLVEVMAVKVQYEVTAPGDGRIEQLKQTDDVVALGDRIAVLHSA